MDNTVDKKRFNRIFRPFKNKMNELITKDKAEFSNSFSITNGENDLSFSPIDNGLELSTNNANNKMIISNDGKITINGVNIERNKKNIDYDERIKYKDIGLIMVEEGYTKNKDIPYIFYGGSAVAIGTDIYLLGSSNNSYYKYNYKYDTTTNTYTQNRDIPYNFNCGSAVAIGTDIYLLGGNYSSDYNKYNYKYDTTTDTYTKNADIPYIFYLGSAVNVDNNIYIFGGYYSNTDPILAKYNYKYDIPYTGNCTIKLTNHSIYTSNNRSFVNHKASIIPLEDGIYYTEYNGNNIIKNTFSIDSNGNTKMYIKSGAMINGKSVNVDTEGWNTINLLDYM